MKIFKTGNKQWTNRHEVFTQGINDLYELSNEPDLGPLEGYNDSTVELQALIQQAIDSKIIIRGLGAGWSWMKIATGDNCLMIDTKGLNTVFNITANSVGPHYQGDVSKLFFAQCGNGIWEISNFLTSKKLSLKTSGASNGQTIAGAIGTGAHGSAFDVGAVQDYVVGLHIITGGNKHVFLERASYPVANDSFIQKLNTQIIRDDDLFNSALVSFGSFGLVHGVMIETEPLFLLEGYMQRMPYDDTLKNLMSTLDFTKVNLFCGSERPYQFEVKINPYDLKNGAYVTAMYKRPYRTNYTPPTDNNAGIGPGDDAAVFVGNLTQALPGLIPTVVNKLLAGALTPFSKVFGTLPEIFNNTNLHGKLLSHAIGIPLPFVTKTIDLLLTLNKTAGPIAGLFAFRFVKKSKAKLAFTKFDMTCVLEVDAAFSDNTFAFYNAVLKMLESNNIPFTYHWGKINMLDFPRLQRMYGQDLDAWIAARNTLLDADAKKVFTNPIMKQWGLDI